MLLAAALVAIVIAPVPVTVHWGDCPGYETVSDGCYQQTTNEMWIRPGDDQTAVYWHEMGHAFDAHRMVPGERAAFACLPAVRPWQEDDPARCGAEWDAEVFADAYANCALRHRPGTTRFIDDHGYEPRTLRRHLNACRFIMRASG